MARYGGRGAVRPRHIPFTESDHIGLAFESWRREEGSGGKLFGFLHDRRTGEKRNGRQNFARHAKLAGAFAGGVTSGKRNAFSYRPAPEQTPVPFFIRHWRKQVLQ